jgi:membrane-associated phospholipid phosphatase
VEPIWQWGLDLIRAIQAASPPVVDAAFRVITFLGDEGFYLVLLPVVLWCVDVGAGVRLFLVTLPASYVNAALKDTFRVPRPFILDPEVQLADAQGYCLPSGHAQGAVVVWGTLASVFRRRWWWVLAVVLSLLIGISRVVLGVHFPFSVLAGWAIGVAVVMLFNGLDQPLSEWLRRSSLATQLALAVCLPLALLLLHPTPDSGMIMGALMGAGIGLALAHRCIQHSAGGPWWRCALRLAVGLAGMAPIYVGLKLVLPGEGEPLYFATRTLRYAVVGLWGALGAPWVFRLLRLSPSSAESVPPAATGTLPSADGQDAS